jgi:hypothetical protein
MSRTTLTVGLLVDHAKAVRIPLFIILCAVVLTFWVDQIWELFLLLTTDLSTGKQFCALAMSGVLGFAVWHTARTVYRFDIPTLPRILGAAVPLLMAVGSASALRDPSLKNSGELVPFGMPILFVVETLALLVFFVLRRRVFHRVSTLALAPAGDPRVTRWSQLPRSVRIVYAAIVVGNVLALILAAKAPGWLSTLGPLAVVLMCASFLTVTGTYLTVQAARWQFPLMSVLFILAIALQVFGCNDNHRVRLYSQMHSSDSPKGDSVDASAPLQTSFVDYAKTWSTGQPAGEPVYLVSAEGGGIRAAAWTALVLSELEVQSKGEFSKHMLLGSGVSGGSLGLAWFAAIVKGERMGVLKFEDIAPIVQDVAEADYLGPTLETMFLTDFLQRFWLRPAFVDRGERLESRWEQGWSDACLKRVVAAGRSRAPAVKEVCAQFGKPWRDLWVGADRVPVLFLNSTEVQSGQRFIEQPFASIRGPAGDVAVVNAAIVSTGLLPASSPLSAVVHNSARFTYVSPAGTLIDASSINHKKQSMRQLVDGGYFENSGMSTLAELMALLRSVYEPACTKANGLGNKDCPIRVIHISNDPGVESMRSDDRCTHADEHTSALRYGEIRAPVMAIMNSRDARGQVARAATRNLFAQGRVPATVSDPLTDDFVFHFRLCKGTHHLPLGWALSERAMLEMRDQLQNVSASGPVSNHKQLAAIASHFPSVSE